MSPPESLIPWSWVSSRLYLAVFLFVAYRYVRKEEEPDVKPGRIYLVTIVSTLLSFLFFAVVPLPRAYYPELFSHRPEELLPAFFFAVAAYGFYRKGLWKENSFHYWLLLSLIISLIAQRIFMSLSGQLFDYAFDAAHLLKKASYIAVLIGVYISMLNSFKQESLLAVEYENAKNEAESLFDDAPIPLGFVDGGGRIARRNKKFVEVFGYGPDQVPDLATWFPLAYPDAEYRRHVLETWGRSIREADTRKQIIVPHAYNITCRNGDVRSMNIGGNMLVSFMDVTEEKQLQDRLNTMNQSLEQQVREEIGKRMAAVQKQKEQEHLLMQQDRFRQMGDVLTNITHHWRQPLNVISLTAQQLEDDFDYGELDKEALGKGVDKIVKTTQKMSGTLNDFRKLVVDDKEKEHFSVNAVIQKVLAIFEKIGEPFY